MKIVLHEIGDCKYTLEIQKSITQNKTFINLTHQELVDLSFALNETLDEIYYYQQLLMRY